MSADYLAVNVARALLREADRIVKRGDYGYRSRSEFVSDAIRRRVDELDQKFLERERLERTNLLQPLEDKGLSSKD